MITNQQDYDHAVELANGVRDHIEDTERILLQWKDHLETLRADIRAYQERSDSSDKANPLPSSSDPK